MLAAAIFAIVTVQILSKTVAASITYCPFNEGNNELVIQNFPLKLLLQFLMFIKNFDYCTTIFCGFSKANLTTKRGQLLNQKVQV